MAWPLHSTADHAASQSVEISHETTMADHVTFEFKSLPESWSDWWLQEQPGLVKTHKWRPFIISMEKKIILVLSNICVLCDAIVCSDVGCTVRTSLTVKPSVTWMTVLWKRYEASLPYCLTGKPHDIKQGQSRYEAAYHAEAKEALIAWVQAGRPRNVLEYESLLMLGTNMLSVRLASVSRPWEKSFCVFEVVCYCSFSSQWGQALSLFDH